MKEEESIDDADEETNVDDVVKDDFEEEYKLVAETTEELPPMDEEKEEEDEEKTEAYGEEESSDEPLENNDDEQLKDEKEEEEEESISSRSHEERVDENDFSSDYADNNLNYESSAPRKFISLPNRIPTMSDMQSGMYNVQMFAFLVVLFSVFLVGAYAKYKYERWMRGGSSAHQQRHAFSSQTTTPNKGHPIEWSEDWSDESDEDDFAFSPVRKIGADKIV